MPVADSLGLDTTMVVIVAIVVANVFLQFYIGRRIARRKGLSWFWWVFFLHWLGVLIIALRSPKPWAVAAAERRGAVGSGYHMPSEANARAMRGATGSDLLYGKRRR